MTGPGSPGQKLLGGGCVGLFALFAAACAVAVLSWGGTLRRRAAEAQAHGVLRREDQARAERLKARLFAESGVAWLQVEQAEAAAGASLGDGPWARELGRSRYDGLDVAELSLAPGGEGGLEVTSRGKILVRDERSWEGEPLSVAEHVLRARVSADGARAEVLSARDVEPAGGSSPGPR